MAAAYHGHVEVVKTLLAAGALAIPVPAMEANPKMNLMVTACMNGHLEVVKVITPGGHPLPPAEWIDSLSRSEERVWTERAPIHRGIAEWLDTTARAPWRSRNRVQFVGLQGRPELNGEDGTIIGLKNGRYMVLLEDGHTVLVKEMNLVSIAD